MALYMETTRLSRRLPLPGRPSQVAGVPDCQNKASYKRGVRSAAPVPFGVRRRRAGWGIGILRTSFISRQTAQVLPAIKW